MIFPGTTRASLRCVDHAVTSFFASIIILGIDLMQGLLARTIIREGFGSRDLGLFGGGSLGGGGFGVVH
jgi:hypothetical protein